MVKTGVIGVGGMASAHMKNLAGFDDVEFAAMCDISKERASRASQEFEGNSYTDFKEMYDKQELGAVYICTPPFRHGKLKLIAWEKRSHLFSRNQSVFI